jgi:hypothetical protein
VFGGGGGCACAPTDEENDDADAKSRTADERNDRDADADADDSARGGERTRWRTGEEKRTAERGWWTRRGDSKEVGQRGERGGRVASG